MFEQGDIAQLTLVGNYLDQASLNVFHYRMEDPPSVNWATGLSTDFQSVVLSKIRNTQNTGFNYTGIRIQSLFDASEIYEFPLGLTGTVASVVGERAPSYMALYFKLVRSNAQVRHGRKMIGGLYDSIFQGNDLVSAAFAQVTDISTALAATLSPGAGADNFKPVIVGRHEYTTERGEQAYRLPRTAAEMGTRWSYVKNAQYVSVSTMNTRKKGRGF